jgi:hypothetical protein
LRGFVLGHVGLEERRQRYCAVQFCLVRDKRLALAIVNNTHAVSIVLCAPLLFKTFPLKHLSRLEKTNRNRVDARANILTAKSFLNKNIFLVVTSYCKHTNAQLLLRCVSFHPTSTLVLGFLSMVAPAYLLLSCSVFRSKSSHRLEVFRLKPTFSLSLSPGLVACHYGAHIFDRCIPATTISFCWTTQIQRVPRRSTPISQAQMILWRGCCM